MPLEEATGIWTQNEPNQDTQRPVQSKSLTFLESEIPGGKLRRTVTYNLFSLVLRNYSVLHLSYLILQKS